MSSSSSRPTSVRDLYSEYVLIELSSLKTESTAAPPSEEWVFLPPTVSPPSSHAPPAPSHLPSPQPLMPDDDADSSVYGPIQLFAAEYFSTALGMPFEVGKTLLQIEYRPRRCFDPTPEAEKVEYRPEEEEVSAVQHINTSQSSLTQSQIDNPEDADMYFTDRLSAPSSSFVPPAEPIADDAGYLPDREYTLLSTSSEFVG